MAHVTFYQLDGMASVLWDRESDRAIAEFTKRKFRTDDPDVIAKLQEAGYPSDADKAADGNTMIQMEQIDTLNGGKTPTTPEGLSPQEMAEAAAGVGRSSGGPEKSAPPKTEAPKPTPKAAKPAVAAAPTRKAPATTKASGGE